MSDSAGDWREGWRSDVTIGFHKQLPATPVPPEDEDEEVTMARAEREKAAQDPVIQDLARRLGVPVHFLLDFRDRAIGQFIEGTDRKEGPAP
jgi:hypothetical protein